jgi:DNA (cytosine-5)-methyltransferase 1
MVSRQNTLGVLDLFSGIGGFSLGLESTGGFHTVAFCEIDKYATRVLNKHWPDVPVFGDIRTVGFASLFERDIAMPDIVCGGFPCQDISLAGPGEGLDGSRSGLWFEMLRIIEETWPRFVIVENVAALRSRGLDTCLRGLAEIGYDAEWHCIPASAVGAPHRRDRVWIIARHAHVHREPTLAIDAQTTGMSELAQLPDAMRFGLQGRESAIPTRRGRRPADADQTGVIPDADGQPRDERRADHALESEGRRDTDRSVIGQDVSDADRAGLEIGLRIGSDGGQEFAPLIRNCGDAGIWIPEPGIRRVANGFPSRVDRLRCLGNAVVPQIPALIGRAIMESLS